MTYTSCWIEAIGVPSDEPLRYRAHGPIVAKLGHPPDPDEYWLPVVTEWARAAGLKMSWVGSAWGWVEVSADQLRDFLGRVNPVVIDEIAAAGAWAGDRRYVISAEEF
jgi:hypothetical protein